MNNLYYVAAYVHRSNEWWRFAISASDADAAAKKLKDEDGDTRFSQVRVQYICPVADDVFQEL